MGGYLMPPELYSEDDDPDECPEPGCEPNDPCAACEPDWAALAATP